MSKQPEALRLADCIDRCSSYFGNEDAADELRRLHAANVELLEALQLLLTADKSIAEATDAEIEDALEDDNKEVRDQANAFLVARAAVAKHGGK